MQYDMSIPASLHIPKAKSQSDLDAFLEREHALSPDEKFSRDISRLYLAIVTQGRTPFQALKFITETVENTRVNPRKPAKLEL